MGRIIKPYKNRGSPVSDKASSSFGLSLRFDVPLFVDLMANKIEIETLKKMDAPNGKKASLRFYEAISHSDAGLLFE
nr:hypothetical protein [Tanacetum cinerariifolium]